MGCVFRGSFRLHRGEILGLAGLIGAGRTEIARAILGIDTQRSGTVWLNGEVIQIDHPDDAVRLRTGYLPKERKRLGLFMEQSIVQNIVAVRPPVAGPWFRAGRAKALAESFWQQLGIRTHSVNVRVENLSGVNQQKTMLVRWLLANPDLLLRSMSQRTASTWAEKRKSTRSLVSEPHKEKVFCLFLASCLKCWPSQTAFRSYGMGSCPVN